MKLVALGVNHKTAPIVLRERLAFGADLATALVQLKSQISAKQGGAVIVSTCNRSEIYACFDDRDDSDDDEFKPLSAEDGDDSPLKNNPLLCWLAQTKGIDIDELLPYVYHYEGNLALTHWLRVAVGLDSMILGEPQILGQVRQAVAFAHQMHAMTPSLDWLSQRIFKAAREVRRDTSLGKQATSIGYAAAKLVTQIFSDPSQAVLLIVAAGEMNRLVAQNMVGIGMQKIIICSRNPISAQALQSELSHASESPIFIECFPFEQLPSALEMADVVSSCSASMQLLIDKAMVKKAMKVRKYRPLLLVDLAVPRDIDDSTGDIDGVYLYSVDDLQYVIAGNKEQRRQAAVEAELLVGQLASSIEADMRLLAIGKTIANYQNLMNQKTAQLLADAKYRLSCGDDPAELLDQFAHRLNRTLTHPPLRLLRRCAMYLDEEPMTKIGDELLHAYRSGLVEG